MVRPAQVEELEGACPCEVLRRGVRPQAGLIPASGMIDHARRCACPPWSGGVGRVGLEPTTYGLKVPPHPAPCQSVSKPPSRQRADIGVWDVWLLAGQPRSTSMDGIVGKRIVGAIKASRLPAAPASVASGRRSRFPTGPPGPATPPALSARPPGPTRHADRVRPTPPSPGDDQHHGVPDRAHQDIWPPVAYTDHLKSSRSAGTAAATTHPILRGRSLSARSASAWRLPTLATGGPRPAPAQAQRRRRVHLVSRCLRRDGDTGRRRPARHHQLDHHPAYPAPARPGSPRSISSAP